MLIHVRVHECMIIDCIKYTIVLIHVHVALPLCSWLIWDP